MQSAKERKSISFPHRAELSATAADKSKGYLNVETEGESGAHWMQQGHMKNDLRNPPSTKGWTGTLLCQEHCMPGLTPHTTKDVQISTMPCDP